jgi:hypothetical protein
VTKSMQTVLDAKVKAFQDTRTILVSFVNNATIDLEPLSNNFNKCLAAVNSEIDAVNFKFLSKPTTSKQV